MNARAVHWLFVFMVSTLFACAYYPALSVPFYLDDFESIVNNPIINTLDWNLLHRYFPMRELGYFSFALNQAIWGESIIAFHAVNLVLHALVGVALGFLSRDLMLCAGKSRQDALRVGLIAAGIFLLLPLNTQAVTYVVQRLAVMAALFYLLGLWAYLRARQASTLQGIVGYGLLVIAAFVAGMLTKQNIITLPAAVLLLEVALLNSRLKVVVKPLLVLALVTLIFLVIVPSEGRLETLDSALRLDSELPRVDYFGHQLVVMWLYIYKFFVPHPLLLEYSVSPYSWGDYQVWLAALGHMSVLAIVWQMLNRAPLVACLILLYYLAHSVESMLVVLPDLAFEHRSYLPNAFLVTLLSVGLMKLFQLKARVAVILILLIFTSASYFTYARNVLWTKPVAFYRHELTYTADNSRTYGALGALYARRDNMAQAQKWLRIAIKVGADTGHLQAATIISYMNALYENGNAERAKHVGVMALKAVTRNKDKAAILANIARIYINDGRCDFAMGMLERAQRLDKTNALTISLKEGCSDGHINTGSVNSQ
ncbi:hypothetical protein [Lacimicrobium sp. SS2-24]|uniref:hypothetical protein n=1 Tax=Lacimicrobium sp. SS2-24 TaxID=2005569 RepID=UPI00113001EA|nr:hypothetical protein [Lacimicrobium sp. SS2-24]